MRKTERDERERERREGGGEREREREGGGRGGGERDLQTDIHEERGGRVNVCVSCIKDIIMLK